MFCTDLKTNINDWLVFITETHVYCAVRVEFLNTIRAEFRLQLTQAVSGGPLTADDRVRSKVSPCGICGGRSGIEKDFSPSTVVLPCQYQSTSAPHSSSCCSYQKDKRANPGYLTNHNVLLITGKHWIDNFRLFSVFGMLMFQPLHIMMVREKACIYRGKNLQSCLHNSQL